MSNGYYKTARQERQSAFQIVWGSRDMETQSYFNRIAVWLKQFPGEYDTKYFDSLVQQWLEFATVTPKQKQELKNMIERHGIW